MWPCIEDQRLPVIHEITGSIDPLSPLENKIRKKHNRREIVLLRLFRVTYQVNYWGSNIQVAKYRISCSGHAVDALGQKPMKERENRFALAQRMSEWGNLQE